MERVIWVDTEEAFAERLDSFIMALQARRGRNKSRCTELHVTRCHSFAEALAAVEASVPNFLITALTLGGVVDDGLAFLARLRARFASESGALPFALLVHSRSARASPRVAAACVAVGATVVCALAELEMRLHAFEYGIHLPFAKLLAAAEAYIAGGGNSRQLAVIMLSGSFNPVHTSHVACFELAKAHLEERGYGVIGGFICPSSDSYVGGKLGTEAMKLNHRNLMCRLAVAESPWLDVAPWGNASSSRTCSLIQHALAEHARTRHLAHQVVVMELCGADHAAKYQLWTHGAYVCLGRTPDSAVVEQGLRRDAAHVHPHFVFIKDGPGDLSSTQIRSRIKAGDWAGLEADGHVHPRVLEYMRAHGDALYLHPPAPPSAKR